MEDHPRARELFQHGYDNAKVSGELWGRTAASAYTAYYQAMEGDYERAAVSLADAQSCQQRLNSPLEGGILHFVSMHIRSRLDLEQRTGSPLAPLLTYSPESYARQGVRLLSSVPSVFEAEQLSQSLRNGIATVNDLEISSLRRFKDDVNSVKEGYEAGINLGTFNDIEIGDIIETFEMQEIERK